MAKILRVVLQVAAVVVNVIPGIGQLASAAIAIGLSVGSSLLAPKPATPKLSAGNIDRLRASIDPRAFRKIVFGTTALEVDAR